MSENYSHGPNQMQVSLRNTVPRYAATHQPQLQILEAETHIILVNSQLAISFTDDYEERK